MAPGSLAQVLRQLEPIFDDNDYPELLTGLSAPDDAAVYRLDDERALVVTLDFFPPIVDDPRSYGAIAASNGLSDAFAMGASPFLALNILAVPVDLPAEVTAEILRGGAEVVKRAGAVLAGGHSIKDNEPKYGVVVVAMARPDRLLTKGRARPGDRLVLTKRLGTGTITTALKRGLAEEAWVREATEEMIRLNRTASEAALAAGARSATDVTGFGFAGHAVEMAKASDMTLVVRWPSLPWLAGARELAGDDVFPGGARDNRSSYARSVQPDPALEDWQRTLLYDPQTSGGLLIAVPERGLAAFGDHMARAGEPFWEIGEVAAGPPTFVVAAQ
jgi:selenide,water dikinase